MIRYIEDLVLFVCDPVNNFDKNLLPLRDMNILYSINSQIKKYMALTENQGKLVTKIFNENINLYSSILNIKDILNNQLYKMQFRKLEYFKKIYISKLDGNSHKIVIEFKPYNIKINNLLKKNFSNNFYRDGKYRYILSCNEKNILLVVNTFKNLEFDIDLSITDLYNKIKNIQNSIDSYIPIASLDNEKIILSNCSNSVINYINNNISDNFMANCRLLRSLNIKLGNDITNKIMNSSITQSTKDFFNSKTSNSIKNNIDVINDTNSYPVLIIMRDDGELDLLSRYIKYFTESGIEYKHISVLYRSKENDDFNTYIKENLLNNFVDSDTKVVFIKYKIPKILYNLEFKPKMILNNLEFNAHFSIQHLLFHHPFVLTTL
jgi:hypothetical protein